MLPFYYRASSLLVFSLSSKPWNQSLFLSLFSLGVIHEILSIIPPSFHTSLFHSDSISSTGPGLNYLTSGPLRHLRGSPCLPILPLYSSHLLSCPHVIHCLCAPFKVSEYSSPCFSDLPISHIPPSMSMLLTFLLAINSA